MRMCCTVTSNALHKFKTPSSRAAVVRLLGYAMRGSALDHFHDHSIR